MAQAHIQDHFRLPPGFRLVRAFPGAAEGTAGKGQT
jgi:hypothetical protein